MDLLRKQSGDHSSYNRGVEAYNRRNFFTAVKRFRKATEEHPDYADYHFALAMAERELGELDHAIASLQRALAINPNYLQAKNELAILLAISGDEEEGHRLFNEAVSEFIYNTDGTPGENAEELLQEFQRGIRHAQQGGYADAVVAFRKAANRKPDLPDIHFNRAMEFFIAEDFESARIELDQALKLDPFLVDAHVLSCRMARLLGDYAAAERACQLAIQIAPDYPDLHYYLAITSRDLGAAERARQELEHAIELHPEYVQALLELVDLHIEQEDWERARQCLDDCSDLGIQHPHYDYLMGFWFESQGCYAEARMHYLRIVDDTEWAEQAQSRLDALTDPAES